MMHTSEYIRIYRHERLDWTFKEAGAWHLWTYIRMNAASSDCLQRAGSTNAIEQVKFGQLLTSKRFLSEQLHMSVRRIDYLMERLVQAGYIQIKEDANSMLISVPGYERFCPSQDFQPVTSWVPRGLTNQTDEVCSDREDSVDVVDVVAEARSVSTPMPSSVEPPVPAPVMHLMMHPVQQADSESPSEPSKNFSQSPIVVEEEKKKENTNLISSTTSTREKEFFEQLRNSESDLGVIMKRMRLEKVEDLLELLSVFEIHILGQDKHHKNYSDFIGHFTNWYPKYKAKKTAKSQAPKPNGTQAPNNSRPTSWHNNLGIDTSATCDEDYGPI